MKTFIVAICLAIGLFAAWHPMLAATQTASHTSHTQAVVYHYSAAFNKVQTSRAYSNLRANPDVISITHDGNRILVGLDGNNFKHYSSIERRSYVLGVHDLGETWRKLTNDPQAQVLTVEVSI